MTRRMLINAQSHEELRIAIIQDSVLENYQFEVADAGLTQGNIYRGRIARIEPSLNAAFIDYGYEKHGFLASQDVVEQARYKAPSGGGRPKIQDVLEKGQPIVVQVTRDPEGRKGAALTTNISLAGRYIVLTPFDSGRGVSRKVESEEERSELKKLASGLDIPDDCGVVVRTNAREQSRSALNRDLSALLRLWRRIRDEAVRDSGIRLLYADQDLILRALRDYLDNSVDEILVDSEGAHEKVERYLKAFMPRGKMKVEHYTERLPLFHKFGLEAQIESIYQRTVPLPSGGSIVIDGTEALTAIDVNSGRSTKRASQEDTAIDTNLEAASEVSRQLRLRDIGGLVVVDFIDMRSLKHRSKVEKEQKDSLKTDKARTTVSRISRNGLLEINRQRLRQPLRLRSFTECPSCAGRGRIPSPELSSLRLLRRIEARAATGLMKSVRVRLHPEVADAFQNQRRRDVVALEEEFSLRVEVLATPHLSFNEEEVEWTALSVQERAEARAIEEAAVESQELTDTTERRRRRRGGSRRSAEGQREDDAPNEGAESPSRPDATPAAAASEDTEAAPEKRGSDAAGDTGEAPVRRRRRRRRRGGSRAASRATDGDSARESKPKGDESKNAGDGDADAAGDSGKPGETESTQKKPTVEASVPSGAEGKSASEPSGSAEETSSESASRVPPATDL